MSDFMFLDWGRPVRNQGLLVGKTRGLNPHLACSNFCLVHKGVGFPQSSRGVFRLLTHTVKTVFTGVIFGFLPTINTPNKDNDKLNKPYYY
jgi:hypothetical protein